MDTGDMGFSTQLLRWWKSKWVGGYKNFQGMVEKHSDTEDLLQSDTGSILRGGRSGVYLDTPLSRLSSHHECEDLGGFGSMNSARGRQRRNSTGAVREGILVDLLNEDAFGCHGNGQDACGRHGNDTDALRGGCLGNDGCLSNERDAVDGQVVRCGRTEACDPRETRSERKDPIYDVTMRQNSTGALEKKKRKEFALTLYDLDGRGQLNRHDIESLVNKMLETLQSNKQSSPHQGELSPNQRETKDYSSCTAGQHRSKTIRINFSISPQSTLGKPSPEGTLENPRSKAFHNQTEGIDSGAFCEEAFQRDLTGSNGVNSNHLSDLTTVGNARHSISTENLLPKSPECARRRTIATLASGNDGETVGEHLRRKLLKVAASAQGESGKENVSPNVNTGPPRGDPAGGVSPDHSGHAAPVSNDKAARSSLHAESKTPRVSPVKRRGLVAEPRTCAKPSIASSTIQNLLSARKTCVLPASAGRLSLLNSNGKFSYEKLEDGGYYSNFGGVAQGATTNLADKSETIREPARIPNDRVPAEGLPCLENEYVDPCLAGGGSRSRPACLLPWEQNGDTRPGTDPSLATCFNPSVPLAPKSPHLNSSFAKASDRFARPQLDLPPSTQASLGGLGSNLPSNGLGSNLPRVLRNRRTAAGVGGRKLRRRHSLCAALSPMLWPQVEDREADVSADQSADEDSEDSEFGTAKQFGALGISPIRNTGEPRWRRKRSSSLLQRQELLQIIRANMEKNKTCFLQPRRKPSFHHHHHPTSHLPFPYNQHQTLPPTCEHPTDDLSRAMLAHPTQQQRRRYTTNSILSQPELTPPHGALSSGKSRNFAKSPPTGRMPLSQSQQDLDNVLSYQFEQHQEKLNTRQQKRSRPDRPATVGALTVANVAARELQHSREFKEYIPIPVISIGEPNRPMPSRPVLNLSNGPSRLPMNSSFDVPSHPYHQKKPTPASQQHRYKQTAKSKQQRRNHSFHFNKSDFVERDIETQPSPLDCSTAAGKLNKNRSFHCSSAESPEAVPDRQLANIRRHFVSQKTARATSKPTESPPSEKDPIYDEINVAESQRLEQELLAAQPLYCGRRDKYVSKDKFVPKEPQPVHCFNLKLNENNRIVFDDSMLPGTEVFDDAVNEKRARGNETSFVYKQKLHASPSTQQKILRRSKSGLIETDKRADDLATETGKLSLDGKLAATKEVEERLYSPVPKHRHGSPKKNARFYKHYNLDKAAPESEGRARRTKSNTKEKSAGVQQSEESPANVARSERSPAAPLAKRAEVIKQSRVVRNLKTFHPSSPIGPDREGSTKIDDMGRKIPAAAELERKEASLNDSRTITEGASERVGGEMVAEGGAGGVVNNHIYINTREHHLCCINVLEHTLCCHSNVTHDQFCCQGNRACKQRCQDNGKCKQTRECKESDRSTVSPCESSKSNTGELSSAPVSRDSPASTGNPAGPVGPDLTSPACPVPVNSLTDRRLCAHGHVRKHLSGTPHCSLHYLKHKYRDENDKLAREQVIKWLENDFTVEDDDGAHWGENEIDGAPGRLSDEDCLISSSESEEEGKCDRGVQLHKHVHHHFYHFDSVLV